MVGQSGRCGDCGEALGPTYPGQPWPGEVCAQCAEIRQGDLAFSEEFRAASLLINNGYQVSCALRHDTGSTARCAVCEVTHAHR